MQDVGHVPLRELRVRSEKLTLRLQHVALALVVLGPITSVAWIIVEALGGYVGFAGLWMPLALATMLDVVGVLLSLPGFFERPRGNLAFVTTFLGTFCALVAVGGSAVCFLGALSLGLN